MGVTPGKKSPKKTPKGKSPAESEHMEIITGKMSPKKTPKGKSPAVSEQMEITVASSEKKTVVAVAEKAVTPQTTSNGSEKKSDSKKKKSLKRKLDDDDYEEKTKEIKNSEAVISEDDLDASQKGSSKKQKKKKQKVDNGEGTKPSDSARKAGLTSGDEKEDEEGGAIPSQCKLFVTSLGLEGMSKTDLKDIFKSHGYSVILTIKQHKSRNAFVGFATEEEAKKARESLDKTDCRGFPLSIDSKDVLLSSLKLIRTKPARLINKDGTADCTLYVSPYTPEMTRQKLIDSFIGVVDVFYRRGRRKRSWARLECINSTVAKELHKSHQGKVVEGTALKLETTEEFRKRILEEEAERNKQLQKQKTNEKKMEKKQKQMKKEEKKSKPEPEKSSDEKSDQSDSEEDEVDDDDEDDDVKVVNDDDDSEEEELPPKTKKAKVAGKR